MKHAKFGPFKNYPMVSAMSIYHLVEYHLLLAMLHINSLINKIFLVTQFAKRTPDDMHRFSGAGNDVCHTVSIRKN